MGTIEYLVENTATHALPERMQELYTAGELMDLTLVCKNGSVKAHKVVVASQSRFLEEVLVQHPCKSPVIVLLELEIDTLRGLVDYMYLGKVSVKATVLDDFIKAANALRLVSVIRGFEQIGIDTDSHGVHAQLVACGRNDSSSFEETVCNVEEVNNFVDAVADQSTTTTTATSTTATDTTASVNATQLETGDVISEGSELVQVQSLEGQVPDETFVTDEVTMAISSPAPGSAVTSPHTTNQQQPSALRTIVISSRANFDQRPSQRLFSQRPVERTLGRTNQTKRRRFDVVALRSRPSATSSATGGTADLSSSGGSEILALPGTGPPGPGGGGLPGVAGGRPANATATYNNRKCESLARIEAGLIGAEQRDGGESNLDELVGVHQQMVVDSNGVRMHQCLLCPQTTAFPSNMKRHIMGHLGIKPFKCQHCDFQSTLRGDLNVHVRKKHPNDEPQQNIIINIK